ncbi:NTTRR-F1 domain [Psychrobacillus sp.]|uniref:NTTRR-F1 domain n=1 Tax=Psychrobacillus TaxID=1221880 RepID=UPI0028BE80B8|nr:NTTRR-F1 domain [Psychrobacillus sp.]
MTIQNLVINGDFETGTLSPWISDNATITNQYSHSGFFSARLQGGNVVSFIAQTVSVNEGEGFELLVSLAKVGFSPAAPVQIQVIYLDSMDNSLGNGIFVNVPVDRIPTADNDTWLEIYQTTTQSPPGATQAFILINSLPQAGTSDILVDDVALLTAPTAPPDPGVNPTFGSLYGFNTARVAQQGVNIEFDFVGPILNTDPDPETNSITILSDGVYEITASLENFNTGGSFVRYGIRRNSLTIPGSSFASQPGGTISIGKTIQVDLIAGDIITVVPDQAIDGIPQYSSAALTVNLIGS